MTVKLPCMKRTKRFTDKNLPHFAGMRGRMKIIGNVKLSNWTRYTGSSAELNRELTKENCY